MQESFPGLKVEGGPYTPPVYVQYTVKAVRAAGTACGANPVSIIVPCHRAQRTDGTLGGYAYGIDRKVALRTRERVK